MECVIPGYKHTTDKWQYGRCSSFQIIAEVASCGAQFFYTGLARRGASAKLCRNSGIQFRDIFLDADDVNFDFIDHLAGCAFDFF